MLWSAGGSVKQALAKASGGGTATLSVGKILPPEVAILSPKPAATLGDGSLQVKATATSKGEHPVRSMRLLVDGRPYGGSKSVKRIPAPRLGEVGMTWDVELMPGNRVVLLDQRKLPSIERYEYYTRPEEVAQAIRDMVVRGAPAIGITAAYGIAAAAMAERGDGPSFVEAILARSSEHENNRSPERRFGSRWVYSPRILVENDHRHQQRGEVRAACQPAPVND